MDPVEAIAVLSAGTIFVTRQRLALFHFLMKEDIILLIFKASFTVQRLLL